MNTKYKYPEYLKTLMKDWDKQYQREMKGLSKEISALKLKSRTPKA